MLYEESLSILPIAKMLNFSSFTGIGLTCINFVFGTGIGFCIDWGFIVTVLGCLFVLGLDFTVLGFFFMWGFNFTDISFWIGCGRVELGQVNKPDVTDSSSEDEAVIPDQEYGGS